MILILILLLLAPSLYSQGDLYLVFGSDTSIWDGMSTTRYVSHYQPETYSAPASNAAVVINETFRAPLRDSGGRSMPFTWWMHSGNLFRHADNCDVPLANTIALHLMKRYHGERLARVGDELSLHYHTWDWTDENGDGIFCWNQARSFEQCREDFDLTLCHYLLEEEVFPVSFRSGWHYMDNSWQAYLDELLPFSLHNAYPSKKLTSEEPTNNIYDWSLATSRWVPYQPSPANYQLPGGSRGWNVRCIYLNSLKSTTVDNMFAGAAAGEDQLACLWSHLPETDFPEQILKAHALIVEAAKRYPRVRFHYMTAVDGYQAWLKTSDKQAPELTFTDMGPADRPVFLIRTDEPIFQKQPFVAIKDIYNRYRILPCARTAATTWEAVSPLGRDHLVKAGVALCDTVGNQTIQLIRYLPDDIFLDNESSAYREQTPIFSTIDKFAWGTDARAATIAGGDSAVVRYELPVREKRAYQLFCQFAPTASQTDTLTAIVTQSGRIVWKKTITGAQAAKRWHRIAVCELDPAGSPAFYMIAHNRGAAAREFSLDALRITPIIPDRQLEVTPELFHFGETSLFTRVVKPLQIRNAGSGPLAIHSISIRDSHFQLSTAGPLTIPPFGSIDLTVEFYADRAITATDSLVIVSDDPAAPRRALPLIVEASAFFVTVDNDDYGSYYEYGKWAKSSAEAYGESSRYSALGSPKASWAQFSATLPRSGTYAVSIIVPATVNATDHALYKILGQGRTIDSLYIDQNAGSGGWVELGRYDLLAGRPVFVQVIHVGGQTAGAVLRADAVRFLLQSESTGLARAEDSLPAGAARLLPNYPNPFNASTTIRYLLPAAGDIRLEIYDLQGRRVRSLHQGPQAAGEHAAVWDSCDEAGRVVASGLYFSRLSGEGFTRSRRMFLVR